MLILLTLLRTVAVSLGKTILFGLLTEKVAVRLIFWALGEVAKRTTNSLDDKAVSVLREAYYAGGGTAVLDEPERPVVAGPEPAATIGNVEDEVAYVLQAQTERLKE